MTEISVGELQADTHLPSSQVEHEQGSVRQTEEVSEKQQTLGIIQDETTAKTVKMVDSARIDGIKALLHDLTDTRPTGDRGIMVDAVSQHADLAAEMADRAEIAERPKRDEVLFTEYLKGNVIIPQSNMGIRLFVLNALLQSAEHTTSPRVYEQFKSFYFTPQKIRELGRVMSAVHHAKGIRIATEEHKLTYDPSASNQSEKTENPPAETIGQKPETPSQKDVTHDRIISSERIQQLWTGVRNDCRGKLVEFIFFVDGNQTPPAQTSPSFREQKIVDFFTKPEYAQHKTDLTKLLAATIESIQSPEGKKLTFAYRESLNYRYVPQDILNPKRPADPHDPEYTQLLQTYEEKRALQPLQQSKVPLADLQEHITSSVKPQVSQLEPFIATLFKG